MLGDVLGDRILSLAPIEIVRGFLYLPDGDPADDMATFEMDVVNATTGRALDTARIPLEIG